MVLFGSSSMFAREDRSGRSARPRLAGRSPRRPAPRRRAARPRHCSPPARARPAAGCAFEPLVALRERLGVRIHAAARPPGVRALGHQVLVDAQHHLAADLQRRGEQQVERAADRALGGVLHRHHGVAAPRRTRPGGTPRRSRRTAARSTAAAELLEHRLLAERALRARGRRRASGCSSARQADMISRNRRASALAGERARVGCAHAAQDLRLALRPVDRRRRPSACRSRVREPRALVAAARSDLVVERVDRGAQRWRVRRSCRALRDRQVAHREHAVECARAPRSTSAPAPGCRRRPACRPSRPSTCSACCGC